MIGNMMMMKNILSLTVASILVAGLAGNVSADCGKCGGHAKPDAVVEAKAATAPTCSAKGTCGAKKSCGASKSGCGMKAALGKLELTAEQDTKIKAIMAEAGCGAEGQCKGKAKKACMTQIKSVLSAEQLETLKKQCHAAKCGKGCPKKAAAKAAAAKAAAAAAE